MTTGIDSPTRPLFELATPTLVSKSDAVYRTHAYHTKVPPAVAAAYIEQMCPEDGLVLDPFCGSGMTGVGAAMAGRRAVLSDISPAAVHIATNYCEPCDPQAFRSAVDRVLATVGNEVLSLYTSSRDGQPATVEYVVWSDVRRCPTCSEDLLIWDHRSSGLRTLTCPTCGHNASKSSFPWMGERPVEASLSTGTGRVSAPIEPLDLRDVHIPDDLWIPRTPFGPDRPMWRKQHADMRITQVSDFFSDRNLLALALLWRAANTEPDVRSRAALRFSLTAIVNRASRRYQWNAKRPTNVLGGTLYIAGLRYEWNVLSLWRRKTAAVEKLLRAQPTGAAVRVSQMSATSLELADNSVDYCFTDPPFGAHIVYSDASLLWEAWLDHLTDREREAIVVRSGDQAKSVGDYGELMRQSFSEIRRVLKPEASATVVFQATDLEVWAAVSRAAREAGLHLLSVNTLDKGQPSFKQIKGRTEGEQVAQSDVVMTFSKEQRGPAMQPGDPDVAGVIAKEIEEAGTSGVSTGHAFTSLAAECLRHDQVPLSFSEVAELIKAAETADAVR